MLLFSRYPSLLSSVCYHFMSLRAYIQSFIVSWLHHILPFCAGQQNAALTQSASSPNTLFSPAVFSGFVYVCVCVCVMTQSQLCAPSLQLLTHSALSRNIWGDVSVILRAASACRTSRQVVKGKVTSSQTVTGWEKSGWRALWQIT